MVDDTCLLLSEYHAQAGPSLQFVWTRTACFFEIHEYTRSQK